MPYNLRKTVYRAERHLKELEPQIVSYGCPEGSPGPCKRVYFKGKNAEQQRRDAVEYAFIAENKRNLGNYIIRRQRSHCCREAKETIRSKSGICINGKHIPEETTAEGSARNTHQHLIQAYLQSIIGQGWELKAYYVSDVPEEFVRKYLKEKKLTYEKIECNCPGGRCFVNAHRTSKYKKQ